MKCSMTGQEKCHLLIQVTSSADLLSSNILLWILFINYITFDFKVSC